MDDIRTKLQSSFSRTRYDYKGFSINVIFNAPLVLEFKIELLVSRYTHEIQIRAHGLTATQKTGYQLSVPPDGMVRVVERGQLRQLFESLEAAEWTACNTFFETTYNITNGTQACLKPAKYVRLIKNSQQVCYESTGADGLSTPTVAAYFGKKLRSMIPM